MSKQDSAYSAKTQLSYGVDALVRAKVRFERAGDKASAVKADKLRILVEQLHDETAKKLDSQTG